MNSLQATPFIIVSWILMSEYVLCEVTILSTIRDGQPLHAGESINFTCVTKGLSQLVWTSDDYIGRNGEQLNLYLINQTKRANSYTTAVLTDRYYENGQLVLVSELRVILQPQFYSSTVFCRSVGNDESATRMFTLAANPSLICGQRKVCPGEYRIFECETRGSSSLSWMSDEYIGQGGRELQFQSYLSEGSVKWSSINPNISANLTFNGDENGVRILRCVLNITISSGIQNVHQHSVTCVNRGLATRNTTTVHMSDACDGSTTSIPTDLETTIPSSAIGQGVTDFVPLYVFIIVIVVIFLLIIIIVSFIITFICWHTKEHHLNDKKVLHQPKQDVVGSSSQPALLDCLGGNKGTGQ